MSYIQPLKLRTWETGHFKMPRFETPHLQMTIFQTVVTVASGLKIRALHIIHGVKVGTGIR